MTAATPTITAPAAPRPSGLGLRWPRQRLLTAAIVLPPIGATVALLALHHAATQSEPDNLQFALLWLVMGRTDGLEMLPVLALFGLLRLVISALTGLIIVYAVLSWVRADSPIVDVIDRLCAPLLRPWRRLIPLIGGIDLSPLAFLVALQVAAIVLAYVQGAALR